MNVLEIVLAAVAVIAGIYGALKNDATVIGLGLTLLAIAVLLPLVVK